MKLTVPDNVEFIINTFYNNGYEAFMVGGCIRDLLLDQAPTDYDIASSAPPHVTQSLFTRTIPTGIKHGTVTIIIDNIPYEVTTYRTEGKYINNRAPEDVSFVTNIKEDLSRRDFTINAFAYNEKEGLLDYFSGLDDLNNKLIKCVGNPNIRFTEDALRILRAIRFSAQLNFEIEKDTYEAIKCNYSLISNISKERIRDEFSKILLCSNPIKGINMLINTNIMDLILPELVNINITNALSLLPTDLCLRLCALLKDVDNHKVEPLLKNLRFSNDLINKVKLILDSYSIIDSIESKIATKKLLISVGRENIFELISLYETCENIKLTSLKYNVKAIIKNNDVLFIKDLNINGKVLKDTFNLSSGKIIGDTLNYLLDLVLNETVTNEASILLSEAKKYILKEM